MAAAADFAARTFDPAVGRLTSRLRLNPWADPASLGNGSTFWRSNPLSPSANTPHIPAASERPFDFENLGYAVSVSFR